MWLPHSYNIPTFLVLLLLFQDHPTEWLVTGASYNPLINGIIHWIGTYVHQVYSPLTIPGMIFQVWTTDERKIERYFDITIWYLIQTCGYFIELDDGKILTGKPDQFDGKNPWVSG